MLRHQLIHPEINEVLGRAGHHGLVLIADGNYPASTKRGPWARVVSLNLAPGIVTCTQVLRTLLTAIPVEQVAVMGIPPDDPYAQHGQPPAWEEYRSILREASLRLELKEILKWEFYEAVASVDHVLTVQTADCALWANVLLTIGCREG